MAPTDDEDRIRELLPFKPASEETFLGVRVLGPWFMPLMVLIAVVLVVLAFSPEIWGMLNA